MINRWATLSTAPKTEKKPEVKFEARPKKRITDYRAFAKDVIKRYPKVMEHLAK